MCLLWGTVIQAACRDGEDAGIAEGRELGEQKGQEIGHEIGFYLGFCEVNLPSSSTFCQRCVSLRRPAAWRARRPFQLVCNTAKAVLVIFLTGESC